MQPRWDSGTERDWVLVAVRKHHQSQQMELAGVSQKRKSSGVRECCG